MNHNQNGKFGKGGVTRSILRGLLLACIAVGTSGIASAQADNNGTLKFKGAVGVIPVTGVAANGTVNLNIVRGVTPGSPWRIADLEAEITPDGHIRAIGHGLLLASGNGIGTNAGQSVHATLFCGTGATVTSHNSTLAGVALQADGDFRIDDFLSPAPPANCDAPVLLIRNVTGLWFAAGLPKIQDHN